MNTETSVANSELSPSTNNSNAESRLQVLERELSAIRDLVREQQVSQQRAGRHVAVIVAQRLFEAKGYKSARQCFRREFPDTPLSTLYRWAGMKEFSEEAVGRVGITKLDLLRTHLNQNPAAVLPADPGEYEVRIPCSDGASVMKRVKDCSVSEIRRSLPKKNKVQVNKKTGNSTNGGAGTRAREQEISEQSLVREFWRAGLGIAMLLVGLLAPSSTLTGFFIPVGTLLILTAARPLIRLGRSWLNSLINRENFFETVVNVGKKATVLGQTFLAAVSSAVSRERAAGLRKKAAGLVRTVVGAVSGAISGQRATIKAKLGARSARGRSAHSKPPTHPSSLKGSSSESGNDFGSPLQRADQAERMEPLMAGKDEDQRNGGGQTGRGQRKEDLPESLERGAPMEARVAGETVRESPEEQGEHPDGEREREDGVAHHQSG